MSQAPPPLPPASLQQVDTLLRVVRGIVCVLVLGISCFNILSASSIGKFAEIFNDMLAGQPLPALSTLVLTCRQALLVLSLLIPIAAIALLFWRNRIVPIYLSAGLVLLAMFQLFFTVIAMMLPLIDIVKGMSAG